MEVEEVDGMLVISSAEEQVDRELAWEAKLAKDGRPLLRMSPMMMLTEDLIVTAVSIA
jgi:hypothetical protein